MTERTRNMSVDFQRIAASPHGIVATAQRGATDAGAEILEEGGRWMGGAGKFFNPDLHIDLKPDETMWQNWYASANDDHRFNEVYRQNERFLCVRRVENYTIGSQRLTAIQEYPDRYLYLVMTQITIPDNYRNFTDRNIVAVRIEFE